MGIIRLKNNLFKWAILLLCLIGANLSWADVWDGVSRVRPETTTIDGKTYFLIESAANLVWFSDSVNETTNGNVGINAKVVAEYIDLDNHPFTPIAAGKGDTKYTGIFDGNGVTIANLYIDSTSLGEIQCAYEQNVGLFGTQGGGSIIKDVILENVYLSANADRGFACGAGADYQISVGPVVGWQSGGTVSGCYASGMIYSKGKGQGVGGIVGTSSGKIMDCLSIVSVNASGEDGYVGGILGYAENSTVESSVYDGNSLVNTDNKMVGGIVGKIRNGKNLVIDRCYYDSDVATSGGVAEGTPTGSTPVGDDDVNTQEYACVLNDGIWNGSSCGDSTGVWMNGGNITNNGVSKNADGETVFLIQFSANGGSFAQGAKTTKILKFMSPLTADEISEPTHDSLKVFLGWSKDSAATKADASLGVVYGKKTIYAVWRDQLSYTVTFDYNTGDGAETISKVVVENEVITTEGINPDDLPSIYTVGENRYYFTGWSASKTGSILESFGTATEDVTFYAQWSLTPKHTVSFNMNGHGSAVASMVVLEGDAVSAPSPSPVAAGYVFGGWYVEQSCITPFNFKTPITENQILYAKWTPEVYSIIYNLDGGTNNSKNPSTYTIETAAILLANPTKTGYVFGGWFYDGAFTNPATQITVGSTGDKTLYAKWSLKTYSVVYNAGQIGQGNGLEIKKVHGVDLTLLGLTYTANGYVQDGWALSNEGEKKYDLGAVYSENAAVTLYPHWTLAEYAINYHLEGGVNHADNPSTYTITTATFSLKDPSRVGYTFGGWYATEDFSSAKVTQIKKGSYGELDLYAKWTQITVTVQVTGTSAAYDGKSHGATLKVTGLPSGYKYEAVTDSVTNVVEGSVDANCVSFIIKDATTNEVVTDKFSVVYETSGSIEVTPRGASFAGVDANAEYTGEPISVTTAATATGLLTGHTHNVVSVTNGTDVGTYPGVMTAEDKVVILDKDGNDVTANYNVTSITPASTGLTISKTSATFTVTLDDQAFVNDGNPHAMTNLPKSTAASGTTTYQYQFEGDASWTSNLSSLTQTAAGTYQVNVKATNPNYTNEAAASANLIITDKAIVTVAVLDAIKVYDGTPLTSAVYTTDGEITGDEVSVTISGSITDVGVAENKVSSCKVTRGGADVTSEYICNTTSGTLTVTRAPLNITTASANKIYNGTPLTAKASMTDLVNGETAEVTATGSQTKVGSSSNTYSISWGTAKASNYIITESLGTLTVTKATATIKVDDAVKLYGDADPVFTGTVTGPANADDLGNVTYYRTNPSVKDAGTYAGVLTASYTTNPNYTVTVTPAKFTINKRAVTLTSVDASKAYDGTALTAPTVTVGGDGFAPDEGAIFTVTGTQTDAGTSKNLFTYVLKAGTDTSKNYTVAAAAYGTLEVIKSPVQVKVTGHSNTYAYNGEEQVVSGFDLDVDNILYSVADIAFSGDSVIRKTKSGTYSMGLSNKKFSNGNPNYDVTFTVVDGSLTITSPVVVVAYNDKGDTLHVIINDTDTDEEVDEKINTALSTHVPPIPEPTKAEDEDSTYAFDGWKKNPATGQYEADFEGSVKLDTVQVKYQDDPEKFIDVTIHVTDSYKDIVTKINATLEENGIPLPSKASDGDSTYTLHWKKSTEGVYEPFFRGVLITESIVVHYGDGAEDTIHVDIRPKDTESQVNRKIAEALDNHLPPIKVESDDPFYTLLGWKKDSKTGWYEPQFIEGELVFQINFHLPEGADLLEEFEGYRYGKVTLLPKAIMTMDPTWVFKGWYTRTKGRGDHVKAMRETDYGNISLYPLFQKTLHYNARGDTGTIEVIYTPDADTVVARALAAVIPADYTKDKKTYTFDKWVLEDDVYTAVFKVVGASFDVFAGSYGFTLENAKLGSRIMVFDASGRVVKRGTVSNGSQRVELPKSGSYTVRVNREAVQVNVR